MPRTFVALTLDHATKDILVGIVNKLKKEGYVGNYTAFDNFHITITFIGETTYEQNNLIKELLKHTIP